MPRNLRLDGSQSHEESFDIRMKQKVKTRLRMEIFLNGNNEKALALATATDQGQLSRMISDHCHEAFPLHKLPAQVAEHGPGLLEWMCIQCGGTFHLGEQGPHHGESPMQLVGLLAALAGKSAQQILQDLEDNHWSREERSANVPGLRKLRDVVDQLLQDAEGGCQS